MGHDTKTAMKLLIQVCKRFRRNPAEIFRCAYEYAEIRISSETMQKHFYSCCKVDLKGRSYVVRVPDFVTTFCEALLEEKKEKRVKLPTRKMMKTIN